MGGARPDRPADAPGDGFLALCQQGKSFDDFPHLAEFSTEHIMQPDYDFAVEFKFGLDLIPTTVLVDQQGRIARIYEGAVRRSVLASDVETLKHEP